MVDRPQFLPVTFIDRPKQIVKEVQIRTPSGLLGYEPRLTSACHDHASDYGYTHWVQPYTSEPGSWMLFAVGRGRDRTFIRKFPSRDAAEMWVLHHAD